MQIDLETSMLADVLVVTFRGRCTEKNARAMTARYFEIVQGAGATKVLADISALEGRLSASETYWLVRDLPVDPLPRGIKTAILESAVNHDYAQFLETTADNAGVRFRCFLDRQEAMAWLNAA